MGLVAYNKTWYDTTNHHFINRFLSRQYHCQKLPKSVDVRCSYSVHHHYRFLGHYTCIYRSNSHAAASSQFTLLCYVWSWLVANVGDGTELPRIQNLVEFRLCSCRATKCINHREIWFACSPLCAKFYHDQSVWHNIMLFLPNYCTIYYSCKCCCLCLIKSVYVYDKFEKKTFCWHQNHFAMNLIPFSRMLIQC